MVFDLGKKYIQEKEYNKALSYFLNELENGNKTANIYYLLGFIYYSLNQIQNSINYYKLALKINPKSIDLILHLANAHTVIGNFLSAKKLCLKAINLDKFNPKAYYSLYMIKPQYLTSEHILNLIEAKKRNINLHESYLIEYLLSKNAKKNENYEIEIKHLHKFQSDCFNFRKDFNIQGLFYYNNIISKHYHKINFINSFSKEIELKNISPIFIIGLPRSGSTLIETLISSADCDVMSLGETSVFNTEIFNQIKNYVYKSNFDLKNYTLNLDVTKLQKNINNRYLNYFKNKDKQFFFVDKSLENFFNIEIILKVFPNAKFVYSKRNYKDSVIGIYQSMLPDFPWAHSIENILNYVNSCIEITDYYEKKFPDKILSIDLENLTTEQEFYSKKIFEFCKLPWSAQILKFYTKKDLVVKTLSNTQLRSQISAYDKKKYKPYEKLLDNFKDKYTWLNNC